MRILLADDCPDNNMLIEAYLKNSPYELNIAENGEIAFRKFASGGYDLVLMDMHMPVMDGYAATRKIRELEQAQGIRPTPIIALTASALDDSASESMKAGCTTYMIKPIAKWALLELIQRMTNGSATTGAAPAPIVVEADADLKEIIPVFLARKRSDVGTIAAAVARRDYGALRVLGRRIKGEGGGFGFQAISELGAALERDANARDAKAAQRDVQGLADFLARVQVVFR